MHFETLISSKVILSLLGFVLIASILSAVLLQPANFMKSRANVFFTILASVTMILIGLSLLVSAVSFEKNNAINRANLTKNAIDKLWLYPNLLLVKRKNLRPEFIQSLYPNSPYLNKYCQTKQTPDCRSTIEEQQICIVMIQAWEDYLTMRQFDLTGDAVWLTNFIQWAQSRYLKGYFDFLKYNYKATTISFAQLLFEYATQLPQPTTDPELYKNIVSQMLKDRRLQDIYKLTTS